MTSHLEYRTLKCTTPNNQLKAGKDRAKCHLIIKDIETEKPNRQSPENAGCFTEFHKNEERIYCNFVCPFAHTTSMNGIEQGHQACYNYHSYQIEKRDNEWFIWRSGKCLNSTVTLDIGCQFDQPFKQILSNDSEIFAKLRSRKSKVLA
uniref:DUF7808 domain-containing protein n=1 Tax=Panagrolaimus superbus TaxID=310955 RepID=A0A914ZCG3_9BILA